MTSIILPAYVPNKELLEVTDRCISSLRRTAKDYQLVVVDNGSYYWARESLSHWADLHLRYGEPIGYARAANIGLAVAEHDWLVVLNTDIEFTEAGWLKRLQADYLDTPGGVLSAFDSKLDEGRPPEIHYDESWFSCFLTRRDVIQRVGYFDESMPYRFHDQDYAIRVKQAGYEVMRDGNVTVNHIDSATYDTMNHDPSEERQAMQAKWGAWCFDDWLRKSVANVG